MLKRISFLLAFGLFCVSSLSIPASASYKGEFTLTHPTWSTSITKTFNAQDDITIMVIRVKNNDTSQNTIWYEIEEVGHTYVKKGSLSPGEKMSYNPLVFKNKDATFILRLTSSEKGAECTGSWFISQVPFYG